MKMAGLIEATRGPDMRIEFEQALPVMKMAGLIEARGFPKSIATIREPSGHENGRPH